MIVNEKQESGSAGHVPRDRLAESTSLRQGVPKIKTGKQSVLPVGRTSQQNSGAARQLGRRSLLGGMSNTISRAGTELEVQRARDATEGSSTCC